jgi:3,4-dihydroxy-2-butanone 4-phosphate synthase
VRVLRAAERLAEGRMVLLSDERSAAGSLLLAAEHADAEAVNFMASEARGVICLALDSTRCEALGLQQMEARGNESSLGDSAMVSIEARSGVTSGVSAADRARTVVVAADSGSGPDDLVQPGHVFPLRARPGGVLDRPGPIEAAVDLAKVARSSGGTVICQILRDDGRTSGGPDLEEFAARFEIPIVTVADVVEYRKGVSPGVAAEALDPERQMREVMGRFATGIAVITTRSSAGTPVGTTANAVCSVSLDPPLLLACLARHSDTLGAVRENRFFAVNILSADQRHHSERFAKKGSAVRSDEVVFADHDLGVPTLPEALATVICEVRAIHAAGDHEIVVADARHLAQHDGDARPLLFYLGSYTDIGVADDRLI